MQARSTVMLWAAFGLAGLVVVLDTFILARNAGTLQTQVAIDYQLYMRAATGWLHGGAYFQPYQLAGPYQLSPGDILYPPVALLLFVPFTVLPAALWWLIPGAAVAWSIVQLRPARLAWPFLAMCVAWPTTPLKILTGNPVIWAVGALSLGVLYAWPSVIVLLKPSLFPFALFGLRSRRWWLALGVFALVSLPFGSLWIDWIHSVLNSQGGGLAYSSLEIPMLAFPVVAWLGRTRRRTAANPSPPPPAERFGAPPASDPPADAGQARQ